MASRPEIRVPNTQDEFTEMVRDVSIWVHELCAEMDAVMMRKIIIPDGALNEHLPSTKFMSGLIGRLHRMFFTIRMHAVGSTLLVLSDTDELEIEPAPKELLERAVKTSKDAGLREAEKAALDNFAKIAEKFSGTKDELRDLLYRLVDASGEMMPSLEEEAVSSMKKRVDAHIDEWFTAKEVSE